MWFRRLHYHFPLIPIPEFISFFFAKPSILCREMEPEPVGEEDAVQKVRSRIGFEVPVAVVLRALSEYGFDPDAAVKFLNDNLGYLARPLTMVRTKTSTGGARLLAPIKQEVFDDSFIPKENIKQEVFDDSYFSKKEEVFEKPISVKEEPGTSVSQPFTNTNISFDEFLRATNTKVMSQDECLKSLGKLESSTQTEGVELKNKLGSEQLDDKVPVKEDDKETATNVSPPFTNTNVSFDDFLRATNTKVMSQDEYKKSLVELESSTQTEGVESKNKLGSEQLVDKVSVKEEDDTSDCIEIERPNQSRTHNHKSSRVNTENRMIVYAGVEGGDFPEDPDWFFVGGSVVVALSTTKGRKLVDNEIVDFNFPPPSSKSKSNSQYIVRIAAKRSGEVDY